MKYKNLSWIILFGGAGRSKSITNLYKSGIKISKILVPEIQSERLRRDISNLKDLNISLIAVDKKNLNQEYFRDTRNILLP